MRKIKRKGLSPVVATVLLVSVVIVIALIIFLWARGFLSERVQKFGSAIELSCDDVDFQAGVANDGQTLDLKNNGNVPIYGVIVKEIGKGTVRSNEIKDLFGSTLNIGETREVDISEIDVGSADQLLVVPILLGKAGSERVSYTCDDAFGYPIDL